MSEAPEPAAMTETEVEAQFEELDVDAPLVGIVMGSKSDMPAMEKASVWLEEQGIKCEVRVMSAHRDPDTVADYAKNAQMPPGVPVACVGVDNARNAAVLAARILGRT